MPTTGNETLAGAVGVPDRATLADFFRRRTGEDLLFMPSCAASVCCAVKNLTGWVCATVPDLDANTPMVEPVYATELFHGPREDYTQLK